MDSREILRPSCLDQFVGQPETIQRLKYLVAEAKATDERLPHILLVSEPGMGKTALARVIASEMGTDIEEIDLSQATAQRLMRILPDVEADIVFLDELHRAKGPQQELILKWAEEGVLVMPHGGTEEIGYLTIIAATTRPEKLDPALVSRFGVQLELEPYSPEVINQILSAMAEKLNLYLAPDDANHLSKAALGCPRTARDLIMAYKTLSYSGTPSVPDVLQFVDKEKDGLSRRHMRYMRVLHDCGGQLGSGPLSSLTRMHPGIMVTVERDLIDQGYIDLTPQGRILTSKGRGRIGKKVRA